MLEDHAIVELYWQRSEDALRETVKKYGNYCRAIIRNLLGTRREDIQECENDTLLSAWNAMPTARPQRLAPFLGRIARNHALDKIAYNRAKKRDCPGQLLLDELEECLPDGAQVEERLDEQLLANQIADFLRMQTVTARGVFVRRYWYGDSVLQIAERYNLSETNVRTILSRVRTRLKAYLEKQGVEV